MSINETALAEAAYRNYMDAVEENGTYSLAGSRFAESSLLVALRSGDIDVEVVVTNFLSLPALESYLKTRRPQPVNWKEFMERARELPGLRFEQSVYEHLEKETYDLALAVALQSRLKALSDMASCETEDAFRELETKYCHGVRAYFSDESATRKHALRRKLTFPVNGKKTLCSYHGKIGIRYFRLHMDARPARGREIAIVYIGHKIL